MPEVDKKYIEAARCIKKSGKVVAFTGAGISVESGIPPFRGETGLWKTYNPDHFHIHYFHNHPGDSWELIHKLFYEFYGRVKPNPAHYALASLENQGSLHGIITQNIDNLHQEAGSKLVFDFHGNLKNLLCVQCKKKTRFTEINENDLPPLCPACRGILKPDVVFFGENISPRIYESAFREIEEVNVVIVVGTTGEVMPASLIPSQAKDNGAVIIEVNTKKSLYTDSITDIFFKGKASVELTRLCEALDLTGARI
jgi:NAD-dependent deacetylase